MSSHNRKFKFGGSYEKNRSGLDSAWHVYFHAYAIDFRSIRGARISIVYIPILM